MKKIVIIFVFLYILLFSEELKLPEEKIIGESKEIYKTKLFFYQPEKEKIKFPEIQIPLIEKKEKEGEVIKKENEIYFSAGRFNTVNFNYLHQTEDFSWTLFNHYSSGLRENEKNYFSGIEMTKNLNNFKFSFLLKTGKQQLPGPLNFPFDTDRNWLNFKTDFSITPCPDISLNLSQKYYKVLDLKTSFWKLLLEKKFSSFNLETKFERQDFYHNFSQNSYSQLFYFNNSGNKIGGEIKHIDGSGIRFLPFLSFSTDGFNVKIKGLYVIPDLWKYIITENWSEIERKKLKPQEGYWLAIDYTINEEKFKLNFGNRYTYWKNFYTWKDSNSNFLFEPYGEKFNQLSFNLNYSYSFSPIFNFFLTAEKYIRTKDIQFYPENVASSGITFIKSPYTFNLWLEYTGKRYFQQDCFGSFSLLNCEIKYKRQNYELGILIRNLTDKKFFMVKGYPGERRNYNFYFKFLF